MTGVFSSKKKPKCSSASCLERFYIFRCNHDLSCCGPQSKTTHPSSVTRFEVTFSLSNTDYTHSKDNTLAFIDATTFVL